MESLRDECWFGNWSRRIDGWTCWPADRFGWLSRHTLLCRYYGTCFMWNAFHH